MRPYPCPARADSAYDDNAAADAGAEVSDRERLAIEFEEQSKDS